MRTRSHHKPAPHVKAYNAKFFVKDRKTGEEDAKRRKQGQIPPTKSGKFMETDSD